MTHAEYEEVKQRTLAMTPEQVDCVLDNVPDRHLIKQLIHRYSKLIDTRDAYSRVAEQVEKAYTPDFADDVLGWR